MHWWCCSRFGSVAGSYSIGIPWLAASIYAGRAGYDPERCGHRAITCFTLYSRRAPDDLISPFHNSQQGVKMSIEEGKAAPAFTLRNAVGEEVALKDLRGRDVIVYFYPRDDTPGCTKEACGFRDLWRDIEKTGTAVLGISPDDESTHQKFAAKYKLPFTLLSDPDKKVMTKYGAFGEKMMYGKKTLGVIRSTVWIGPDGKVKKHWKRVAKAADHPGKVLEALQGGS
jgi:peroxiredoxin Q/BCP